MSLIRRGRVLLVVSFLAGGCASTRPPARADDPIGVEATPARLALDVHAGAPGGFVRVREGPVNGPGEGTHLTLRSLGVRQVETVSASMLFPIGTESDLRVRLRDVVADGSSTLGSTVLFNEVRYDAGTSLRVRPFLADGLIDLRLSVLDLGGGARLKLLAGLDFKYLDFKTWGTISAQSSGTDKNEDFYRQSLPLPSLGLGVTVPLSPDVFLEAEAFGFRAIGWDSGRPEGGTVYLTQDDFEASLGIVTRLAERWELAAGLRYDYLHINEYSLDDGNEFQLRNAGVFAAVRLRL